MISARNAGITPEELINKVHAEHSKDFADFYVDFDNFHTTHCDENREFSEFIYSKMKEKGLISETQIEQLYCEHDKMFLPDRFIKGSCPKCKAADQYGDSCDACSATYAVTEVIEPYCSLCKNKPVIKKSTHYFFQLSKMADKLRSWIGEGHLQPEVVNKLNEWFNDGLRDWDISRDAPYFGFNIPGSDNKFFYVWLDAPVGYMASLKNWALKNGRTFEEMWQDKDSEIYHFIGKDILYFHTLFWPAMLMTADFKTPDKVFVHGMLKVDNEKMSKSKGTFINAKTYLKYLNPEYLRYYYASKLGSGIEDINLSLKDFLYKVNSELVGNITNIASRVSGMLNKTFAGVIGDMDEEGKTLFDKCVSAAPQIAGFYEQREFSQAVSAVIKLADDVNKYVDNKKPWALLKENADACHRVLSSVLNCFKTFMIYLKPVLPKYAADAEELLNVKDLRWHDIAAPLQNHKINEFKPLAVRIEQEKLDSMIGESKESQKTFKAETKAAEKKAGGADAKKTGDPAVEGVIDISQITIEDFHKVDLRVGKIIGAQDVDGADKLLQLTVSVGGTVKNIFAGIKSHYKKEDLNDKLVVVVNNLKPRKMKFGMSEGMVIAASAGDKMTLLTTMSPIEDGAKIS
jgi:methionyl-tRNA synthetase